MALAELESGNLPEDLAVVVPAYNPGGRVESVVRGALERARTVIVVDDGCTDGSMDPIRAMRVKVIAFEKNRGKGHALLAGYRMALEDPSIVCVATLDADGQHDPGELPRLYEAMFERKADFVIGARAFSGGHVPLRSRFGNVLTVYATRVLASVSAPTAP